MLRARSKNMLMVAASVTALVSSGTALAQQTSTTQGVLQNAPTDQAASPSAAASMMAAPTPSMRPGKPRRPPFASTRRNSGNSTATSS